jgi:quinol-cytochrome oxidoreductase complex cytochrome b subunit
MDNNETTTEKEWSMKDFNYPVPEHAKQFGYAVGGVTFVGFILLIITGIVMTFFFTATVDKARDSVLALSSTPWGLWLRSFHRWLAETVIFLIILHMTRIVFTGSYRESRKTNWFFGIALLVIALAFLYTGTVVKWDQEGYEAYRHLVEQVELVPVIGAPFSAFLQATSIVMTMFVAHTLVLPLLFLLFLIPHLVLMKLNGLSPLPGKKVTKEIKLSKHIRKIFGWSFVIYGFISYLAMQFPAELYPGPYTGIEMTKPPWILLVLYQFEDWFGVKYLSVFPLLIVIGLILIPYFDSKKDDYSLKRKIVVWSYIIIMALFITFIIHVAISAPVKHLGG